MQHLQRLQKILPLDNQSCFAQPFKGKSLFTDILIAKYEASYYLSFLMSNDQDDSKSMLYVN